MCHAVVYWYGLDLTDSISLATGPDRGPSHWKQMVQLLLPPKRITAGEQLSLPAAHDCSALYFSVPV